MEVPYNHFWWCGYYQGPWVSFVATDEFSTRVLKMTLGQKRSTFVSRNWPCENCFITYPPAQSNVYQNTYFLLKKQNLSTNKKQKNKKNKREKQ